MCFPIEIFLYLSDAKIISLQRVLKRELFYFLTYSTQAHSHSFLKKIEVAGVVLYLPRFLNLWPQHSWVGFKKQHAEKENIRVYCFCCYFCKVIKNVGSGARPPVGNPGHHVYGRGLLTKIVNFSRPWFPHLWTVMMLNPQARQQDTWGDLWKALRLGHPASTG